MGQSLDSLMWEILPPKEVAYEPKFDPMLGFPNGRKERVMVATEEEMYSACLDRNLRDYCAHKYLAFLSCKKDNFPFVYRCHHELHDYHQCEFDDHVLRMKEKEREERLTKLMKKKQEEML